MKLYLAHPLVMRHEVREWEQAFEERTKIELLNPFYDQNRDDVDLIDKGVITPRTMQIQDDGLEIVERDIHAIFWSDGLVAFLEKGKESFGTPMEIFYNSWVLKRPTYTITYGCSGHPWIRGLSTKIFKNPEEFEKYVVLK